MLSRDDLKQIATMLRPLKTKVANSILRAVVSNVDDSTKRQVLQIGVLEGEPLDGAEHFQPYGYKSVPRAGAESVVIFPNGDHGHPLVIVTDDRNYRPPGWDSGDAGLYNNIEGTIVRLMGPDIEINPGPGGTIYIRNADGTAEPVVKKSEFDAHVHPTGVGPSSPPTIPAIGTQTLKVE